MLKTAKFAFMVMTREDTHSDGSVHARENVVHEAAVRVNDLRHSLTEFSEVCRLSFSVY